MKKYYKTKSEASLYALKGQHVRYMPTKGYYLMDGLSSTWNKKKVWKTNKPLSNGGK